MRPFLIRRSNCGVCGGGTKKTLRIRTQRRCFIVGSPEFFYGFICVAVAWQVLFLVLSTDPIRYRPMMVPAMLEKIGFPIAVVILYLQGRLAPTIFAPAAADLILFVLFVLSFRKTR